MQEDYITKYLTPAGFDLPALLHDDFASAFRILWNHKHYVSASKLLVSAIDSLAFLEFGDEPRAFQSWLENFANLSQVNATPDELWEFRNALLHTTTPNSRKISQGKVRRLCVYVGTLPDGSPSEDQDSKWVNLWSLYMAFAEGISRFCEHMNRHPEKSIPFFERYDQIVSDARYLYL